MVTVLYYIKANVVIIGSSTIARKIRSTRMHDERLSSYVEAISYPLSTYPINNIIVQAIKEFESYKQASGISALWFATKI